MKIVDTRRATKTFGSLDKGDTFMYNNEIYMKVAEMQTPAGRAVNAIMLGLGIDVRLCELEQVEPINCELHIANKR